MPGDLVTISGLASTADVGLPRIAFWVALAVVAGARLAWFGQFLLLVLTKYRKLSGLKLLTSQLYVTSDERDRAAIHLSIAEETNRIVDFCLLVGTIAFAAWTALFAVANQTPGSELSSTTRALLLVGAIALVAAPMIFRAPDYYTTYLGRRSAQFIGLTAVGLAFASLSDDLLRGNPRIVVALAGLVILVARDVADTVREIIDQGKYVGPMLLTLKPTP